MSNYIIHNGELYHYGVPGMKWGHRKAYKYQSRANTSRESAKEWEEMARYAEASGKTRKAARYLKYAKSDLKKASQYDWMVNQEAKSKAKTARESAKEWEEIAKYAESRGKTKKADKYRQYAKDDLADASNLDKMITKVPRNVVTNRMRRKANSSPNVGNKVAGAAIAAIGVYGLTKVATSPQFKQGVQKVLHDRKMKKFFSKSTAIIDI